MKLKKVDTLFHGTKKISQLISILENGFYPSYADEKFAGRNTKILMVSFSNIPLIEARNQVNYGNYFIGLKRSWGINKKVHPVAYSYEYSQYEKDLDYLQKESAIGQVLRPLKEYKEKNINFDFEGDSMQIVKELTNQNISEETLETLKKLFENIFIKVNDMQLYLKHYSVIDRKGIERYSYNDREWRFVPNELEVRKLIFETDASGKNKNPDYVDYSQKKKPHFKSNALTFEIDDINYIIVKQNDEIKRVLKSLEKRFGKEKTFDNILSGKLTVLSLDKIWSDL